MTLKRVKDWTPPKHPKSVEDIDKYLNQHYRDHVDESFARIQDFYEQSKIGDASDVSVSGEAAGELLIYNATDSQWENAALTEGAGISITEADASITITLAGTKAEFDTACSDGDFAYSGGAFHDGFSDFVANEHIDHSSVSIIAGTGLSGGGDITSSRTLNCDITQYTDELAQDAIGGILDDGTVGEVVFTYDDSTPKISAVVQDGEIDHNALNNTHNLTTDIDHNSLTNTHNLTTDIDHDSLTNFSADEHVAHSSVTLTAGTGLTGGGDISANRTFNVDIGIADNKIVQVDGTPADDEYAKWTASGLEGRSYAQVLSDLSGQAGAAFSWNDKNLEDVPNLSNKTTAAWSKTIGSGGDYVTWAAMIADMPDLIAHAVTVTIKKGTTLTETCDLKNKNGLTSGASITIQAEEYFPQSGALPTASSATATTLVDSSQSWAVDRFIDCWVLIVDGTGTDNGFVKITDSDATSITVASWPGTQPDNTSRYLIVGALIDCEDTTDYGMYLQNVSVLSYCYGIGIKNADRIGLFSLGSQNFAVWYCGIYNCDLAGIMGEYGYKLYIYYSGVINNNTDNLSVYGGIKGDSIQILYVRECGISDNNNCGILAYRTVGGYVRSNFGDNNGTWGTYAEYGGQVYIYGTECSGSSGNHSDPGTAGNAHADQAAAY